MAAVIADQGFRESTVADVVRIARTSRRTFYEHFEDRDACFLALFDATNDALMLSIAQAISPELTPEEQIDGALDAYIEAVADHPALYRSFVRELPGLGLAGAERQMAVIERFADLLVELVDSGRRAQPELGMGPLDRDAAIMIVGGLRELAVIALQRERDIRKVRGPASRTLRAIILRALAQ